ncbi:MAG: hypothetical protein FWD13_08485 [Treponema sp.]|nr:hypothetical protein [Treponema sp.]
MRHFNVLRIISLLLVFSLVTFSCATGKNQVTDAVFGFTAEAVPEGLLLTFNNIPPDIIRLFISVQSWDDKEELENGHDIVSSYADIRDASFSRGGIHSLQLESVKETGKVIFPIVQPGQKYYISAMVQTKADIDNDVIPIFINKEIIAGDGIYFNKEHVTLELNNTNSAVTLLSEPLFSSDVIFNTQKYDFSVTIIAKENGSIGLGTHHIPAGLSSDGLSWVFEPNMTNNLRINNGGWLESGNDYPAWAIVYVNIIHDDIIWSVEIAKTPEFNFSL